AGKRRQQNELAVEIGVPQFTQKVDPGHVRHLDVGNDEVEFRAFDLNQRFFGAHGGADNESFFSQKDLEQFAQRTLVIDDQNFGAFCHLQINHKSCARSL